MFEIKKIRKKWFLVYLDIIIITIFISFTLEYRIRISFYIILIFMFPFNGIFIQFIAAFKIKFIFYP